MNIVHVIFRCMLKSMFFLLSTISSVKFTVEMVPHSIFGYTDHTPNLYTTICSIKNRKIKQLFNLHIKISTKIENHSL